MNNSHEYKMSKNIDFFDNYFIMKFEIAKLAIIEAIKGLRLSF